MWHNLTGVGNLRRKKCEAKYCMGERCKTWKCKKGWLWKAKNASTVVEESVYSTSYKSLWSYESVPGTAGTVANRLRNKQTNGDKDKTTSKSGVGNMTIITSHTHTHTHPFNGPLSGTTWVSWYQNGKTNLDFTEARDSEWQWYQLGHMQVCTSLQTYNHASTPPLRFLQAGCSSCRPTNSIKAQKAQSALSSHHIAANLKSPVLTWPHAWDRHSPTPVLHPGTLNLTFFSYYQTQCVQNFYKSVHYMFAVSIKTADLRARWKEQRSSHELRRRRLRSVSPGRRSPSPPRRTWNIPQSPLTPGPRQGLPLPPCSSAPSPETATTTHIKSHMAVRRWATTEFWVHTHDMGKQEQM